MALHPEKKASLDVLQSHILHVTHSSHYHYHASLMSWTWVRYCYEIHAVDVCTLEPGQIIIRDVAYNAWLQVYYKSF